MMNLLPVFVTSETLPTSSALGSRNQKPPQNCSPTDILHVHHCALEMLLSLNSLVKNLYTRLRAISHLHCLSQRSTSSFIQPVSSKTQAMHHASTQNNSGTILRYYAQNNSYLYGNNLRNYLYGNNFTLIEKCSFSII